MSNEKRCPTCKTIKSFSEFYKNRAHPDGLTTECKPCNKNRAKEYAKTHAEKLKARREEWKKNPRYTNHTHKKCTGCKLEKSVLDFYKNKAIYDGYSTECKECSTKRTQELFKNNPEKRCEIKERWRKKHPHYVWAERTLNQHKENGYKINISVMDLANIARNTDTCFFCKNFIKWSYGDKGKILDTSPSLDRLNNENYIDKNNIAIVHHTCNTYKGARPFSTYIQDSYELTKKFPQYVKR